MRREEATFFLFAIFASFAACTGGEFEVGSGSGAATSSTSSGQGGATSSTTSGGGGASVSSSVTGMGGESSSTQASNSTATTAETATTSTSGSGEGGSNNTSSNGGSGGAGGGGMDLLWCEANGANFNFCSDFDDPDLLAGWTDFVFEAGLTGTPNTMQSTSEPVSLKVSSQSANNGNWGVVEKDLTTTASFTLVEFDFYYGGSAFQAGDAGFVDIATISYASTSAIFGVDKMGFYVHHQGGVDVKNALPAIPANTWVRVGLTVAYSGIAVGGEVGVSYDGVSVGKVPNVITLADPNSMDLSLFLGQMRLGSAPAVETSFDNVTWLVNP